jgi:hypothetical protein
MGKYAIWLTLFLAVGVALGWSCREQKRGQQADHLEKEAAMPAQKSSWMLKADPALRARLRNVSDDEILEVFIHLKTELSPKLKGKLEEAGVVLGRAHGKILGGKARAETIKEILEWDDIEYMESASTARPNRP